MAEVPSPRIPATVPGDENAIVVSNFFFEILPEAKVGDWLTIDIDGKETEWQIIGIYKTTVDTGNHTICKRQHDDASGIDVHFTGIEEVIDFSIDFDNFTTEEPA